MSSFEINIQPSKVTSQYKEGEKTPVTTEKDKEKILNEALDAFFDGDIKKGMALIQQLGVQFKISDTRISFEYNGRSYWVIAPAGGDFTDDVVAEPTSTFAPTVSTSADALQKAIKDMGLRATSCDGVYCEQHNPSMPAGNYSNLRHYYWDAQKQEMILIPNVYYVSYDGHEIKAFLEKYNAEPASVPDEPTPEAPAPAPESTPEPTPEPAPAENNKYKEAAATLSECAWKNSTKSRIETLAMKQSKINTKFDIEDGKIVFSDSSTKRMYDDLLDTIKSELLDRRPDAYKVLGGDEVLEKLFQAAWLQAYNSFKSTGNNKTEDFLKAVMNNLQSILKQISQNPDVLDVLTAKPAFGNENLTKGLAHYNTNDTYGGDEKMTTEAFPIQDANGTVHFGDKMEDKYYQETMNELFERICNEYPTVDKDSLKKVFQSAQLSVLIDLVLKEQDFPQGVNYSDKKSRYINMDNLVDLTLYYFDKELMNAICDGSVKFLDAPRTPEAEAKPQERSAEQLADISAAAPELADGLSNEMKSGIDSISNKYKNIHTEFGIDENGKIVFENKNTTDAYKQLREYLEDQLTGKGYREVYAKLKAACGDDIMDKLFQAAWIQAYNKFASSQSNNTKDFMTEVINNLTKMLNSLKDHPEKVDVYTSHTSYADKTLTKGLVNYNTVQENGKEVTVDYKNASKNTTTGIYTLRSSKDNALYQDTMSELLGRLQEKYSDIDKAVIKDLFLKAQEMAFSNMGGNVADCPYGTGNNSGRVEDIYDGKNRDWGGKNTRKGDDWDIQMDQLVQMVLYNFDKLLMAEMAK